MWELSSSTSPMACTRRLSLEMRVLSPRPVVPSSPVRVAICVRRLPIAVPLIAVSFVSIVRQPANRMFPRKRQARLLARRSGLGCNAHFSTPRILPMHVKRRRLPDFETCSVALFATLALRLGALPPRARQVTARPPFTSTTSHGARASPCQAQDLHPATSSAPPDRRDRRAPRRGFQRTPTAIRTARSPAPDSTRRSSSRRPPPAP